MHRGAGGAAEGLLAGGRLGHVVVGPRKPNSLGYSNGEPNRQGRAPAHSVTGRPCCTLGPGHRTHGCPPSEGSGRNRDLGVQVGFVLASAEAECPRPHSSYRRRWMFVQNLGLTSPVSPISGNSPWSQKSKGENPTVPGSASRLSPGPNASHRFLSRLTSPWLCGGRTVGLHVDRRGTWVSVGRASAARCRCPPPTPPRVGSPSGQAVRRLRGAVGTASPGLGLAARRAVCSDSSPGELPLGTPERPGQS